MTTFESDLKVIPYSQERVYTKLSNLMNLEAVKNSLPDDKVKEVAYDADTLSFNVPAIGELTLKVVEREPSNFIKLETVNSPLPFTLWIKLAAVTEEECTLKVSIAMALNPFMKTIIQKPLTEGLAKIVDMLATIQY